MKHWEYKAFVYIVRGRVTFHIFFTLSEKGIQWKTISIHLSPTPLHNTLLSPFGYDTTTNSPWWSLLCAFCFKTRRMGILWRNFSRRHSPTLGGESIEHVTRNFLRTNCFSTNWLIWIHSMKYSFVSFIEKPKEREKK